MAGPNPGDLTANDLNAAVYHYLVESGFVHTAFNFNHEALLDRYDVEGKKIPQGTLIRVVQKGLRHIEFEANAEVADDENFHHFSALDLLTKDVGELTREITGRAKPDSVETAKEKKNDTVKTVEGHRGDYADDTILYRIQPARKAKDYSVRLTEVSSSDSDEISRERKRQRPQKAKATEVPNTTVVHRRQPVHGGRGRGRGRGRIKGSMYMGKKMQI